MARHEDQIVIAAPVKVVFDTVADQRNEPSYNPAMVRSEKVTTGPIRVGTRFTATVTARGRPMDMLVRYVAFDRPRRIESVTQMALLDIDYLLTFQPHPEGTLMRWSWRLRPRGRLRVLAPVLGSLGRRQERRIWTGLKRHVESRRSLPVRRAVLAGSVVTAVATGALLRRWYARWGATAEEAAAVMPGDELVPSPKLAWTRAVTVAAPPEAVWPWLAQVGQGRGGFYSYDAAENLIGCDIHSAQEILPEHQHPRVGDLIRLAPGRAPCYRIAQVDPPRVLVLVGADPDTQRPGPTPAARDEQGATWAWTIRAADGGRGTRLVVRQRYSYPRGQTLLWHLLEPVDFVMERRMLLGIKQRAEHRQRWPQPRSRSRP